MSRLNQIPTFRSEDFATEQAWISKLFIQLNPFVQSLQSVINQGIDFTSNIRAVSKSYDITSFTEFSILWPYASIVNPVDVRVMKAVKGSQQTPCILMLAWSYSPGSGNIVITNLIEVSSSGGSEINDRYQFTIRASV